MHHLNLLISNTMCKSIVQVEQYIYTDLPVMYKRTMIIVVPTILLVQAVNG